tara:strand:- start:823 stop:1548 length:726 start_codon:yes stop_codon:yes gene_type:complete
MNKVGIIGYGEIGKAVEKLYPGPVLIKDLDRDDGLEGVEVLHICIPYSDSFIDCVQTYIQEYKPLYTIIHSTIPPTTTEKLVDLTGERVVHSPVRGVHPDLLEGLLTFEKYVGADFDCFDVLEHLNSLGIKTKLVSSKTSELAKLLSTTYYGMCIAWHGEMKEMCDELGVDFEEAATNWNNGYNEGYNKLGMGNVTRPVLYPPKKIGGHCIIPNAIMLRDYLAAKLRRFNSPLFDLIFKWK